MMNVRKLFLIAICSSVLFLSCKKQELTEPDQPPPSPVTMTLKPVVHEVSTVVGGYYVGLPSNYDTTTNKLPLFLFFPGAGEFGNGNSALHLLLTNGPTKIIAQGKYPANIKMKGKYYNYIVFTPQFKWWPNINSIKEILEFVKINYRVDTSRIYISGLSMGGTLASDFAIAFPSKIAAVIPMAGVTIDFQNNQKCKRISDANLPVWAFHSEDDAVFDVEIVKSFVSKSNYYNPWNKAKLTIWPNGGHDAWTRALEPTFKENDLNIYEWMLQFKR
jgi:predicted peptidase